MIEGIRELTDPDRRHPDTVDNVSFSGCGSLLASCCSGGTVKLWNVATRSCVSQITKVHDDYTYSSVISPKDHLLATSGTDGKLHLWTLPSMEHKATLLDETDRGIWFVEFSARGTYLACAWACENKIMVFDTSDWRLLRTFDCPGKEIQPFGFTHDESSIIANNEGVETICWDLATGAQRWRCCPGKCYGFYAVSKDEPLVAIGGKTPNFILIKDSSTGETLRQIRLNSTEGGVATFVRGRPLLALGGSANLVRIIDINTGSEIHSVIEKKAAICSVASSPDGRLLAWGTGTGKVMIAQLRE